MVDLQNKIFYGIIKEFISENKFQLLYLLLVSTSISICHTYGISPYTSKTIDSVVNNKSNIWKSFVGFSLAYLLYQFLYYLFYQIKSVLVNRIKPWARYKLMHMILDVNTQRLSQMNFTKLNSPIHRISDLISIIVENTVAYFIPNVIFVIIIGIYFLFINPVISMIFVIGNFIASVYYYFIFNKILEKNIKYEKSFQDSDGLIIDLLNNMDKVIVRGKVDQESKNFKNISEENELKAIDYYASMNKEASFMSLIILITFLVTVSSLIYMRMNEQIDNIQFLTSLTVLMLFREKLVFVIETMPEYIGYIGRMKVAVNSLKDVESYYDDIQENKRDLNSKKYKIAFEKIEFKNITFSYKSKENTIQNKNVSFVSKGNEILGIVGPSGTGKTTFVKLLLKLYPDYSGQILIDDVNIRKLDPLYIRENITYVSQTGKLFDKKIIENMFYGCDNKGKCMDLLLKIFHNKTIQNLFKNIDIVNDRAGLLGENLSGGQRQVINLIEGLLSPSKILILDEPTNALDKKLKKEIIKLIRDCKQYKSTIIIISHDRDVFSIFDKTIQIQ